MSAPFKTILLSLSMLGALSSTAIAHPHNDEAKHEANEKTWPYFGESDDGTGDSVSKKIEQRFELHSKGMEDSLKKMRIKIDARTKTDDKVDDIRAAADAMSDLLADSDVFTDMADMVTELANDFELEDGEDGTKIFLFDGKEMGRFKHESDKNDRMKIGGLGQNLSIERETYVKNGKTKTRIVIEMDGGEDVEIDLPALKDDAETDIETIVVTE